MDFDKTMAILLFILALIKLVSQETREWLKLKEKDSSEKSDKSKTNK